MNSDSLGDESTAPGVPVDDVSVIQTEATSIDCTQTALAPGMHNDPSLPESLENSVSSAAFAVEEEEAGQASAAAVEAPTTALPEEVDREAMPPPPASVGKAARPSTMAAATTAVAASPLASTLAGGPTPSPNFTKKCTPQRVTSAQILLMLKVRNDNRNNSTLF